MLKNYGDLIYKTIVCIKTFDPVTHSVDTHFEDYLQLKKLKNVNEQVFIKQIFYGVIRYEPLMKVVF